MAIQVRRVGTCLMALVAIGVLQEGARNLLLEGGGWAYWGGMMPLWLCFYVIGFCSMHFQMKAFQAPSGKEAGQQKYTKEKASAKIAALNDSSCDIQPMNNA